MALWTDPYASAVPRMDRPRRSLPGSEALRPTPPEGGRAGLARIVSVLVRRCVETRRVRPRTAGLVLVALNASLVAVSPSATPGDASGGGAACRCRRPTPPTGVPRTPARLKFRVTE